MKRRCLKLSLLLVMGTILLTGCGKQEKTSDTVSQKAESVEEILAIDTVEVPMKDAAEESIAEEPSAEEIQTEMEDETVITEVSTGIVDQIPVSYVLPTYANCGRIEEITYSTKDYYGDGAELTKSAFVYLPNDYDESKQYNVLYLMHGIGGNEREWGMVDSNSKVKAMMDHLIENGEIEPFIIVTPNGRSSADFANTNADYNAFYKFGEELRNDLIPYIDANYATYAEYSEDGYDLTEARDHRAMAGLSMGGMQTTNIGMCECLDIISYFGAFSAAPTTYPADKIVECLQAFKEYDINYYYGVCGTGDGIALASSSAAVTGLTDKTDKLTDGENFAWQTLPGGHDFQIWNLGFYNFARLVFQ